MIVFIFNRNYAAQVRLTEQNLSLIFIYFFFSLKGIFKRH